jgi:hypothetical protein
VGGGVDGHVTVTGGTLVLSGATVSRHVRIRGGGSFFIGPSTTIMGDLEIEDIPLATTESHVCGTHVRGDLRLRENAAPIQIGSEDGSCPGNTIRGNFEVDGNSAATGIIGNTVGWNLDDHNNAGPTQVFDNTVRGRLLCYDNNSITGGGNTARRKEGQCKDF